VITAASVFISSEMLNGDGGRTAGVAASFTVQLGLVGAL